MEVKNDTIRKRAEQWLTSEFDDDTRREVAALLETDDDRLADAFYKDLEFGTGGLRGKMGVGTNRMNRYTVGMATQGLANYLKKVFADKFEIKVAIAYDCRNNSPEFSQVAADILSANGITVYLFDALRPTPELSFAVRELKCQSGIVITASHNPKEYNGYKVYWEDGAQIIAPHDKNIIEEVKKITSVSQINFNHISPDPKSTPFKNRIIPEIMYIYQFFKKFSSMQHCSPLQVNHFIFILFRGADPVNTGNGTNDNHVFPLQE